MARSHPEVATPFRSVRVDLFGTPVMACDLEFRVRRVAPRSLRDSEHHRAIWAHRLIPWCTETGGSLIEACPACSSKLGWYRAKGTAACDKCGSDLRDFDPVEPADEVRAAVDPYIDLLSPDSKRHGPALDRLAPEVQSIGRGAAFELGWTLACAFGAPAGSIQRQRQAKLPAETHVVTLVNAARLLESWPWCVERELHAIGETSDATGLEKTVRRLRADFRLRRSWPELSAIAVQSLPNIFSWPVRARSIVHAHSPRLVDGTEATKLLGTTSKKFSRLYRTGKVSQLTKGGGERNAFATYNAVDLTASGAAFRDKLRIAVAAGRLGITINGIEQLICLGALDEIDDDLVVAVCPGRQISSRSFDRLIDGVRNAATFGPDLTVPISKALGAIGGREKPYGPLLVAMHDGRLRFALQGGAGSLLERITVSERDAATIGDACFDQDDYPDFRFATSMTRMDAIKVLNLTPPMMIEALREDLVGMGAAKKHLCRDQVLAMAAARVSPSEIRHRWMEGRRKLPSALKPGGIIPRLGVTGWSRSAVTTFMEGDY